MRGERFDLIATNPPFVISPATGERLVYRDSGLPGDQVVEDIVRAAPDHLTERGWCQVLANWVVEAGRPGTSGWPAGWPRTCDALVVQREVLDPAAYVELWLKDSGHHPRPAETGDYRHRYDTWLSWFEEQGIEAIGFGWINLRRRAAPAAHDLCAWPYDVEQPIAPAIADWASAIAAGSTPTPGCVPAWTSCRRPSGRSAPRTPRRSCCASSGASAAPAPPTPSPRPWSAPATATCGGRILDAVAQLLDLDPAETRAAYLPVVRELVDEGFLVGG